MRILAYLAWLGVVALGLWVLASYQARWDLLSLLTRDRASWKVEKTPQASISVTYLADQQRWLNLPIPAKTKRLRIVSTANLRDVVTARAAKKADPLKRWPYSLEIEISSRNGRVLYQRKHQYLASLSEIKDEQNRLMTSAFYLTEALTPANSVAINIDLSSYPEAANLRIRTGDMAPEIADIVVRTYVPQVTNEKQVAILWQRLSEKHKANLAKGSVFLPEMLIEEEKRNLVRNLWQALGPLGAEGVDFKSRELYALRELDGELVDEYIPPEGIITRPGQVAVFSIPEQGGVVRFEAQAVHVPGQASPPSNPLRLVGRWYGATATAREDFSLQWAADQHRMTKHLDGGLVELVAPYPVALRAFMEMNGKETEITPQRSYKRLFLLSQEQSIRFNITHALSNITPLRLEARSLLPNGANSTDADLLYDFLDAQGKTLKSGILPMAKALDRYDQIYGEPLATQLSDVVDVYFSTPPEARQLRLTAAQSPQPILVAVYNRPADLARQTRIPEDSFAALLDPEKIPAWFALRPLDYEALIIGNQSRLIGVQSRPPDEKSDIQAGLFAWEDFRPRGTWLARKLLLRRDPTAPRREEAFATTFEPLPLDQPSRLDFPAFLGVRQLTPTLLWINQGDTEFLVSVSVDGRLHHTFQASGRYGEVKLPPLAAGRHELQVSVSPNEKPLGLFINHGQTNGPSYATQIANIVIGEMVFDIERHSHVAETFTARFFQPANGHGRRLLRLRIEGPPPPPLTPLSGWVFAERQFDIRPDPAHPSPVFDTQGQTSDAGRPAYIAFPVDAPLGRYRFIFNTEQGPPAYLTLSRLTSGPVAERRILEEPESRHVLIE